MKKNASVYPKVTLWNDGAEKINFINEDDFRKDQLLKKLDIRNHPLVTGLGVMERGEIDRRQRILKFFIKNPIVSAMIRRIDLSKLGIPLDGQGFLNYFAKRRNIFWKTVGGIIKVISAADNVPNEIETIVSYLKDVMVLEEKEQAWAKKVADEVQKTTLLEGMVKMQYCIGGKVEIKSLENNTYGYKKYSFSLANKWSDFYGFGRPRNPFLIMMCSACESIYNFFQRKVFFSPLIITNTPKEIVSAITDFMRCSLMEVHEDIRNLDYGKTMNLTFGYTYDGDGLRISLIDVEILGKGDDEEWRYGIGLAEIGNYVGYSKRELRQIKTKRSEMLLQREGTTNKNRGRMTFERIKEKFPSLCYNDMLIVSEEADASFKWFAVSHLCREDERFQKIYEQISTLRKSLCADIAVMKNMLGLYDILQRKSKEWGLELEFPNILEDNHHLVSFDTLHPIHLEDKDLVSIRELPPMNGQMIGFTGQNAGGKSTTMETIISAIYLAQSGLPIFGKNLSLNVKKVVGMVFLERGSGSTCQLLLEKYKSLLESLEECEKNGIILFLDEIGTGTQEMAGLDFGKKLLRKLSESGCSVVFCTQITELAEYAKNELEAKCFKFNLHHQISTGIGLGGIDVLMNKIGIDELLNQKK